MTGVICNITDEGGLYLNLVGAGGCRGTKWDKDPRWPKFLGRETLDACAAKCAADDTCTAIHALRHAQHKLKIPSDLHQR